MSRRYTIAICVLLASVLGYWFARALGVPVWTTYKAGDACDIGFLCGLLMLLVLSLTERAEG